MQHVGEVRSAEKISVAPVSLERFEAQAMMLFHRDHVMTVVPPV